MQLKTLLCVQTAYQRGFHSLNQTDLWWWVASHPLEMPPFLSPVPLGSPHTPHAINSSLSCHRKKRKDRGILLQPGLCQPYPIPDMPLCSQEPVGGYSRLLRDRAEWLPVVAPTSSPDFHYGAVQKRPISSAVPGTAQQQ